jgi:5'-nucleotidase/UDP-sugar diphosphatase
MMRLPRIALCAVLVAVCAPAFSQEKLFTIVHTNDMHSHLEGFAPELDYTPRTTGDDATLGGWARIATAIRNVKADRGNPVLVLDAGDFLMGSLFHMVSRERGVELRLLKKMGYDAVGLGNHEFDLKPDGLARILTSANAGGMPLALLSNAVFSAESAKDDSLEKAFSDGLVKPYTVMVSNGVKIGIFALMGKEAAEVAPFSSPVEFRPPAEAAKEMVKVLRETEKVDMVVCISHSGLWADPKKSEDVVLAQEVPGIDVIVSGHTHTKLDAPLVVNGTIIVQAWEHGKQVGVLDFAWKDGKAALRKYTTVKVNDAIPGDPAVQKEIDAAIAAIDRDVLMAFVTGKPSPRPTRTCARRSRSRGSGTWSPTASAGTWTRSIPTPPIRRAGSPLSWNPMECSATTLRGEKPGRFLSPTFFGSCHWGSAWTTPWRTRSSPCT